MPELTFPNVGSSLIRIHKVISRALAVSLEISQGAAPPPDLREGFQRYEQTFYTGLLAHHDGEDEIAFPFFMTRFPGAPFDLLSQQHRIMIPLLDQINDWCQRGQTAWEPANLVKLHLALSDLSDLWHSHIPIEESCFSPSECQRWLTSEENAWLDGQLSSHAAQHAHPSELVLPFVLYNLEGDDRAAMALTMPPSVAQQLVPFAWKDIWAPMQPYLLE